MVKTSWYGAFNIFIADKLLVLVMVLYPMLFVWQGLDFTDTGFLLTNYQQIFLDPQSVEATFRIWLSNILGGIWLYFFGDAFGLLGYRVAAVILVYAALVISFLILRPYLPRRHLLLGLLIALIFINRSGFAFSYNSLTALFYLGAVYLLIKGLQESRVSLIFTAAFVLGLNIFIRLPNSLGFALIITIPFYGRLVKMPGKGVIRGVLIFTAGFISAVFAVLVIMSLMGHLDSYIGAVKETIVLLGDPIGHHSTRKLTDILLGNHTKVLVQTGVVIFCVLAAAAVLTASSKLQSRLVQYLLIFILALLSLKLFHESFQDWFKLLSAFLGILYLVLIVRVFGIVGDGPAFRAIALASGITLVLVFLGSNNGILNAVFGMYLPIPILFSHLMDIKNVRFDIAQSGDRDIHHHFRLETYELRFFKILTIALFLAFTLQSACQFTYRDSVNRLTMIHSVDHPRLRGIFTSPERAVVVNELLLVLPGYVDEGEYLLAYEQIPMIHFLTKTRPYLYSPWPMLYSPAKFERLMNKALQERPYLPVIIRAKGSTERPDWPKTIKLTSSEYLAGARKIMDSFISRNKYHIVWENDFFEILEPGVNDRK